MQSRCIALAVIALVLIAGARPVQAVTIVGGPDAGLLHLSAGNAGLGHENSFSVSSSGSPTLSLPKFDQSIGTLTGVEILLEGSIVHGAFVSYGNIDFFNVGVPIISSSASVLLDVDVVGVGDDGGHAITVSPFVATNNPAAYSLATGPFSTTLSPAPAALPAFIGGPGESFEVDVTAMLSLTVNRNTAFSISSTSKSTGDYTYSAQVSYTFVPEPSLSLLALATIPLLWRRRKRTTMPSRRSDATSDAT